MKKETVKRELLSPAERERLENNPAPVFMHYQGQTKPQPAFILISPEQEHPITVSYNANIGNGVSSMVWHGRELGIPIQPETTGQSLLKFIAEYEKGFWYVVDSCSSEWDGNNLRGKLTDEASDMLYNFEQVARRELETVPVYNTPADLWIDDEITADCNPQELAEEIIEWKQGEGAVLQFDIEELTEYITERQKELFGEDE